MNNRTVTSFFLSMYLDALYKHKKLQATVTPHPQDNLLYQATKNKAHQQKLPIFLWWFFSAKTENLFSILNEERKYISST